MTELEIAPTTIRCCECHLNLPCNLFTHSDSVCDFCRRKRIPNPTGKEWEASDSGPSRVPIPDTATEIPSEPESPATPHKPRKDYKIELVQQCELAGLKLEPEFRFHPERKFRADWRVCVGMWEGNGKRPSPDKLTYVPTKVLVEYEGGIFSSGKRGHSSISGIRRDIEKSNIAQICGYLVIRVAPDHVVSGVALKWIEDAVKVVI